MKTSVILLLSLWLSVSTGAQQALQGWAEGLSPRINDDGSVTFVLNAPQAAVVTMVSNCAPGGRAVFEKEGENWVYTTPVLKPALYWVGIGSDDFLYDENVDLRKRLDEAGMKYEYVETPGSHTWDRWRFYLTTFASKIFK